jgi:hypothetical protein
MSLITEDGTGKSTAESYIGVTDADTYHTNRGNTAWTGAEAVKEAALRKATDYMEQVYRSRWKGLRVLSTQALSWPRNYCYVADKMDYFATDEIPTEVKNACAKLALKSLSGALYGDLSQNVTEKTVGPITKRMDPYSPQSKRYVAVDAMLAPYLDGTGGMIAGLERV